MRERGNTEHRNAIAGTLFFFSRTVGMPEHEVKTEECGNAERESLQEHATTTVHFMSIANISAVNH